MPVIFRLLLPLLILGVGWGGYAMLSVEKEEAKRPPPKPRTIKTTVKELRLQDYITTIETQGVIRPHNEVALTAEVSGRINEVKPIFEDGAFFAEGDILLELDASDFETAVAAAEAQLARSEAALAQEQARAKQARLNWDDLGYSEEPNDLVLRKPQLREAEANVKAAEAQLAQAQRDLTRTKVRAPFDGRVRMRQVGLGQSVGPGTAVGVVFSVEFAEVRLPLAAHELPFLELPEGLDDPPLDVELRDALSEDSDMVWAARIVRTEGTLDEASRELFAIARLDDPFGRKSGQPPLRIGQPVLASITGHVLKNVYVVPREAVRQLNSIFLVDRQELTLDRRTVEPIWEDKSYLIVRDPTIDDGSLLSTSYIVFSPNESKVEIIPSAAEVEMNAETKPANAVQGENGATGNGQTGAVTTPQSSEGA